MAAVNGRQEDDRGTGRAGSRVAADFASWYTSQAQAMVPRRLARWLTDSGAPRLVIGSRVSPEVGAVSVVLTRYRGARQVSEQCVQLDPESLSSALRPAIAAVRRAKGEVALEVAASRCLTRSFGIPREAARSLDAVLAADIARRTPLTAAEVYHGHMLGPVAGASGALTVTHSVLRRDLAAVEADRFGLALSDIDALVPVDETGASAGPAIRVAPALRKSHWLGRCALALVLSAVILAAVSLKRTLDRLDANRTGIETRITSESAKAKAVRQQIDGASAESALLAGLTTEKMDTPGLMEVWDELSRLLPDGTWITEVLLSEDKPGERVVTINGFSDGATALVAALAHSPMLSAPALTSAITPDTSEGKDRFALQTRLVKAVAKGTTAR